MAGTEARTRTAFAGSRPHSPPEAVRALLLASVGPALWFGHLNASYLLVPPSCEWRHGWAFVVVTAVALAGISGAGRRSWALWDPRSHDGPTVVRFLGMAGVVLAGLFALTTLLVGASALVVHPCH
ncbi:hypothetical protein NHL50_01030 [Acidimicrobiia bacterium EGI L10123]|uniref:hypothetical protein n=1 Tax=Salinilacustrithrix flava TaxID=2957203 RepID=UPI003D7C2C64|nr:hypothetical protein [Acidimicrobiia bacterium EGI L10123]